MGFVLIIVIAFALSLLYCVLTYTEELSYFFFHTVVELVPAILGLVGFLMLTSIILGTYLVIKGEFTNKKIDLKKELIKIKVGFKHERV